ncbi:SNF2 family N-terminal domain containing protein [Trichomonas vaginalis G3]|uniref:SNF2 family N-terminal domain containing protein n=1 Tax=Trichomonas vaginalis (strain ATCC PRA-98 / G3) TaxID=412133 RepID=A2FSS0_TRIV3|nr:ATP-dependent helicase BRM family [Trichomonas vaginalis G3]EAX92042.1 SNF2 family N-terminal domain containing protein [Trichomonas vaginalis G3]KAI5485621.1 ATP-dependent helicase BRM family [Trichomonas vaginalis G3]|eukprot:XP_001304972.1 SNF2 family N-terminal domain containing protein [Trichomonas vaginalis G3]
MSTSINLPSELDIDMIIQWIKSECSRPNFDSNSPEFQAAIAVVAANDRFRQADSLKILKPEETFLHDTEESSQDTVTKMLRVAMFRNVIRKYQVPPQIQRGVMPIPTKDQPVLTDNSVSSLQYLTPHTQAKAMQPTALNAFRAAFLNGEGQPPEFLAERRMAILVAAKAQKGQNEAGKMTAAYSDAVIAPEVKIISAYKEQLKLRQDVVKFTLDPLGYNLPDYASRMLVSKSENYHTISPQHIGIHAVYDIVTSVERSKKSTRMNLLQQQANLFRKNLNSKFKSLAELNHALSIKFKNSEKEKKGKNSESARLQALRKNNFEEYRRLVDQMKDDRIKMLLEKTDKYMKDLTEKIKTSNATITEGATSSNPYNLGLKPQENVTQPQHLNGQLKDYQLKGLQWLVSLYLSHLNGILADEMGLGKTIQSIALLAWLMENRKDYGPHLICGPLTTLSNWYSEFNKWLPAFNVVQYTGTPAERKQKANSYLVRGSNVNVVLTSYEFATRDKATLGRLDYSYLIIDEAHRLKNDQGKLGQALSAYKCGNRLLLTGTPLQNNPRELWSLLNFVLPNIFNDHSQFEEWFSAPFSKAGGDVSLTGEEQFLVISQLHNVLRPFLFRRTTAQVATELPKMRECKLLCAMSAWQKVVYNTLVTESSVVHSMDHIQRLDNTTMQLRKCCNHPYLFYDTWFVNLDLVRTSGKCEVLDRILPKLKATGHRILIFSQMTEVLTLLQDLLTWRDYKYLRLDGNTKSDQRQQLIADFNKEDSEYFIFLLSTRAGGLGLNLQTADTVILYDNDWNPFADQQARSRVHRIGQEKPVLVISLVTAGSIEERVVERADDKKTVENKIIEIGRFDDSSNLDERKRLYQRLVDQSTTEDNSGAHSSEQINRMIARSPEEYEIFQKMDVERNQALQKQWIDAGRQGKYPSLITFEELPDFLKVPFSVLKKDESLPSIRKSRSSTFSIAKLENMTDSEYTRMIDRGEDPTDHIEEIEVRNEQMSNLLQKVKTVCQSYFDVLPTPEQNPIYYQVISNPITLLQISQRVSGGDYDTLDDFVADLRLMANNAQRFNEVESIYYSIASQILQMCDEAVNKGTVQREIQESEEPIDFD